GVLLLQHYLQVEVDGDVVAEGDAAGLEGRVPADAEVVAVDLGRGACGRLGLAVAVGDDATELTLEGDGLGDAAQRELTLEGEVIAVGDEAGRTEGCGREL